MAKSFNTFLIMSCFILGVMTSPKSFAVTTAPTPDLSQPKDTNPPPTQDELDRANLVHVTEPPPVKRSNNGYDDYFFRYRHSLVMRTGVDEPFNDLGNPGAMFGLLYWFPTEDLHGVELGTELDRDGNGIVTLASRTIIGDDRLRWFYKFGGGIRIVASDQLVTVIRPRNWQLRAGGGFEWSFSDPLSTRCDLEIIAGTERVSLLTTLGIAVSW